MSSILIHQPEYLPWINLFFKMAISDTYVLLDSVQYARRTFQNRNNIKTKFGMKLLTVPLKRTSRDEKIANIEINNVENWKEMHLRLIQDTYRKAKHFDGIIAHIEPIYKKEWSGLSDLNCRLIETIARILRMKIKFVKSSELAVEGHKADLILNICLKLEAQKYVSGIGGKEYLNEDDFRNNNIEVIYLQPAEFEYEQIFAEQGFLADLSMIDYLFNCGTARFKNDVEDYLRNIGLKNEGIRVDE